MNPVLLQKQLKENANDLQDFCKDLQSWGEEMKRKEDSLKSTQEPPKKPKVAQPKQTSPVTKRQPKEKLSRIGSTDYAKWEKFDADLECERLEDDLKDDSELTDEFEETARDEAICHKEQGNSYVKKQEWNRAIECYTKAINCYAYDPIFYANRALCYLKIGSYISAEEDCTLSLRLDSTYVKALQRRAAARESLGKCELAKIDLELVLTLEPKNKESFAALENIKRKIGVKQPSEDEQRPVSKFTASRNKNLSTKTVTSTKSESKRIDKSVPGISSWPDPGCDIINVKPIKKPPQLRSKKPLKRIEITELDSQPKIGADIVQEAFKKNVIEHVEEKTPKTDAGESIRKISSFRKTREQANSEKIDTSDEAGRSKASVVESDDLRAFEKKPKDVKNNENIFITKMDNKTVQDIKEPVFELPVPKTAVQFYSAWKSLSKPIDKYKYLKSIDPQELPSIFRESLDSKIFSSIIEVLANTFIEKEDNVYQVLFMLTKVKRFTALTMFMDSKDKNYLWRLIIHMREKENVSEDLVSNLVSLYEL